MAKDESHSPVKGVTIENCLRYINAVEEAAKRDIKDLPIEDRSFMLGLIKVHMQLSIMTLDKFQATMEEHGDATPVTHEQKLHFQLMLQLAFKDKVSDN